MKIYFLRHGQALHDVDGMLRADELNDDGLTPDGQGQVKEASKVLGNLGIARILSSDTLRTKQSTEIANRTLNLAGKDIVFDPDLREMGVGNLGKNKKSLAFLKQVYNQGQENEYGAESYDDLYNRACRVVNRYKEITDPSSQNGQDRENQNTLFVGHGLFNSMLNYCICEGTNLPFNKEKFKKQYNIRATNAAITEIDMDSNPQDRKVKFIHGGTRLASPELMAAWDRVEMQNAGGSGKAAAQDNRIQDSVLKSDKR